MVLLHGCLKITSQLLFEVDFPTLYPSLGPFLLSMTHDPSSTQAPLIDLVSGLPTPILRGLARGLLTALDPLLGIDSINQTYARFLAMGQPEA